AYAPWPDLEALLRARGLPLVSLESHLPLADFHVLGFSLQYELTYTNLLTMLELGRVPLRAAARGPAHPLVIAGGPCAFNPEPARARVAKRVLVDLDRFAPPANPVVPNVGVVHDRASVEVMRGCVKGCRFCQAGYIYRPLRERNPERLVEQTAELMRRTGYEEVSLLSLSTGDYSGVNPLLKELMDRLVPERVAVSLPSTRVDALSPRILEQIRRVR